MQGRLTQPRMAGAVGGQAGGPSSQVSLRKAGTHGSAGAGSQRDTERCPCAPRRARVRTLPGAADHRGGTCVRTRRTVNLTQVIRPRTPGWSSAIIPEAQAALTAPRPPRPPTSGRRCASAQPLCLWAQAARPSPPQPHAWGRGSRREHKPEGPETVLEDGVGKKSPAGNRRF